MLKIITVINLKCFSKCHCRNEQPVLINAFQNRFQTKKFQCPLGSKQQLLLTGCLLCCFVDVKCDLFLTDISLSRLNIFVCKNQICFEAQRQVVVLVGCFVLTSLEQCKQGQHNMRIYKYQRCCSNVYRMFYARYRFSKSQSYSSSEENSFSHCSMGRPQYHIRSNK